MVHPRQRIPALGVLALFLFASVALANPIMSTPTPYGWAERTDSVFRVALAALAVEWLFIWIFFINTVRLRSLLMAFVVINLITFPLTWVFSTRIGLAAEILPLVAEPLMYMAYLRRKQLGTRYVALKVIGANLASFIFGLIVSHGYIERWVF